MKKYKIEVIITEGNDEFWEEIGDKSGCDEVLEEVKDALDGKGFSVHYGTSVRLISFIDE